MPNNKLTPEQEMSRRTRRGFIALGAGAVALAGGWKWLNAGYGPRPAIFRRRCAPCWASTKR